MGISNFEIQHVNKGTTLVEGSFESEMVNLEEITNDIANMVFDNFAEGSRFDVHTLQGDRIFFDDEDGETVELQACISHIVDNEYRFSVGYL